MGTGNETGANVEYFFRLLYELIFGGVHGGAALAATAALWWVWITLIGYLLTILGFGVIVYTTVRLFELRHKEEEELGTMILSPEAEEENPRWKHIQSLLESNSASDWRQAIIEADIMLDDMLARQNYQGAGVGEKLQKVEPSDFATLQDAWEAHKVRNQIAHQGSSFILSEMVARRTLARYEAVFREFGAL